LQLINEKNKQTNKQTNKNLEKINIVRLESLERLVDAVHDVLAGQALGVDTGAGGEVHLSEMGGGGCDSSSHLQTSVKITSLDFFEKVLCFHSYSRPW